MRRICLCLLLLPAIAFSQQTIDAEQFFASGMANYQAAEKPLRESVDFPWINRFEFRTETRDFDLAEQEYTLRLSPSTAKIRNAQKAYYEELASAPDFEERELYCELLLSLHTDWLALYILKEEQRLLTETMAVLNDKQTLYERMMGTYEFDLGKLVRLQTEKNDMEIAINKLQLEQDRLLDKYELQGQEVDFDGFTTIEDVSTFLAANVLSLDEYRTPDLELEHEEALLMREMELELSEEKQLVDFLQFKYNGPHSDPFQERFSIGLGFQLSNSGSSKLKLQELQIEQEEVRRESARGIQEKQATLIALEEELQRDLQAFFYFQEIMENEKTELQSLSETIAQKEGTSPLLLLDIAERHLAMEIKSLNRKEDLLEDYLEYIHRSGKMCQSDFVNYLAQ